jgi:hypothetical protein
MNHNQDDIKNNDTTMKQEYQKVPPTRLEKMEQEIQGWSLLPKVFSHWDLDGNHALTLSEVNKALSKYCANRDSRIGITPQFIQSIFEEVDVNHDGTLDYREFSVFLAKFADAIDTSIHELAISMISILSDQESSIRNIQKQQQHLSSKLHYIPKLRKALTMKSVISSTVDDIELCQLKEERDSLQKSVRELQVKLKQREAAIEHLEHAIQMQNSGNISIASWNSIREIADDDMAPHLEKSS